MQSNKVLSVAEYQFQQKQLAEKKVKRKNKYNNTKVYLQDGTMVHSKLEAEHRAHFELLLRTGQIKEYKPQAKIVLLEPFEYKGEKIRGISYIADHYVISNKDEVFIYDSKGFLNPSAEIKLKLLKYRFPNINFRLLKKNGK